MKKKYQQTQIIKLKKNQDYGSNDKIKNKLKFDKNIKNKNLKPKH